MNIFPKDFKERKETRKQDADWTGHSTLFKARAMTPDMEVYAAISFTKNGIPQKRFSKYKTKVYEGITPGKMAIRAYMRDAIMEVMKEMEAEDIKIDFVEGEEFTKKFPDYEVLELGV